MKESSDYSIMDYGTIPISALKTKTREVLSVLLDSPKIIPTHEGIPRDWRGLAACTEILNTNISNLEASGNQTSRIIYLWSQENIVCANFKKLEEILEKIDRYDVLDDTLSLLESDARAHLNSKLVYNSKIAHSSSISDNESITRDDANLALNGINRPQFYDAFVLYADEDIDFVKELVERMESYGFKLCLKDRDILAGVSSEHSAIAKLVGERCHRLIIILSPAFVKSNFNNFIVDNAMVGGIKKKKRKIIPCIYEQCEIPQCLIGFFLLDYRRNGLVNFWDKLKDSLLLSPDERLALNEDVEKTKMESSIPTITITNNSGKDAVSLEINKINRSNSDLESKSKIKKHTSMLDLDSHNSESLSISNRVDAKNRSNPSIYEKKPSKKWYKNIINPLKIKKKKSLKMTAL